MIMEGSGKEKSLKEGNKACRRTCGGTCVLTRACGSACVLTWACMHACLRVCAYALLRARLHEHSSTRACVSIYTIECACVLEDMCVCACMSVHPYTSLHACVRTCTCGLLACAYQTHLCEGACQLGVYAPARKCVCACTCGCLRIHACMPTQAYEYARVRAHLHEQACVPVCAR